MATEDAEHPPPLPDDAADATASDTPVSVGRYSWRTFVTEHGHADAATELYADIDDEPIVPASAVNVHVEEGVDRVVRSADVDEPFVSDGDTAVSGHGTPEPGTAVIGTDHVVLSGSTVVPDGTSTAVPESASEDGPVGDSSSTADTAAENGKESGTDEENGDANAPGAGGDSRSDPDAANDGVESPEPSGIDVGSAGVPGSVVVTATDVETVPRRVPTAEEWSRVDVDPSDSLGFDPAETPFRVGAAAAVGDVLWDLCSARYDLYEVPVLKGYYTWDDYREEYFLDEGGKSADRRGRGAARVHSHRQDRGARIRSRPNRVAAGSGRRRRCRPRRARRRAHGGRESRGRRRRLLLD